MLHRLRQGDDLGTALAEPVRELAGASPASRLNLLLTDGTAIAATAWGDSLWYLSDPPAQRWSWRRSRTTTIPAGAKCPTGPC